MSIRVVYPAQVKIKEIPRGSGEPNIPCNNTSHMTLRPFQHIKIITALKINEQLISLTKDI